MKKKECILWGKKRHIFEMEYMFDDWNITGYVPVDQEHYEIKSAEQNLNEMIKSVEKGAVVIICDSENSDYSETIANCSWEKDINYVWYEECFGYLDAFSEEKLNGRKVAVWGTGDTANSLPDWFRENHYNIEVNLYIDSNADKKEHCGKTVKRIDEIENLSEYFIIVASIFYFDIKEVLEARHLVEGEDYCGFSVFQSRPSFMMQTLVDSPRNEAFTCTKPYVQFFYGWHGAFVCCPRWTIYPVGNPAVDTPEACWNSVVAKLYRLSMENKTFCFCDPYVCGDLGSTPVATARVEDYRVPAYIKLGLDPTCNLYCKSCRDCVRVVSGDQRRIREKMAQNIIDTGWLSETMNLEISNTGDPLFSPIDRNLLFSDAVPKGRTLCLQTNGLLLDEEALEKLVSKYAKIKVLVSIDAATEATYLQIRRGGDWNRINRNMEFLSNYRKTHSQIDFFEIRMVVQHTNYKEIEAFVDWGMRLGVDSVLLTKLLNWELFSDEQYHLECLIDEKGKLDEELKATLLRIRSNKKVNIHEFERYL